MRREFTRRGWSILRGGPRSWACAVPSKSTRNTGNASAIPGKRRTLCAMLCMPFPGWEDRQGQQGGARGKQDRFADRNITQVEDQAGELDQGQQARHADGGAV